MSSCTYETADAFLEIEDNSALDCMLLDIRMPGMDGLELFCILRREPLQYPIIFITGHGDIPLAVSAIKLGAYDVIACESLRNFPDGIV